MFHLAVRLIFASVSLCLAPVPLHAMPEDTARSGCGQALIEASIDIGSQRRSEGAFELALLTEGVFSKYPSGPIWDLTVRVQKNAGTTQVKLDQIRLIYWTLAAYKQIDLPEGVKVLDESPYSSTALLAQFRRQPAPFKSELIEVALREKWLILTMRAAEVADLDDATYAKVFVSHCLSKPHLAAAYVEAARRPIPVPVAKLVRHGISDSGLMFGFLRALFTNGYSAAQYNEVLDPPQFPGGGI